MYTCHFVHISCFVYTFSLMHTRCPIYAHPHHAHYFFILIDTFVQFRLSLLAPSTCFSVLTLVAHAYLWFDANSMLSSHLFTSCSCHIFICFPHTFFASCTVIILCTVLAFIYIFSSFMHLLYSYLALACVFLFCLYSAHCSFSFVSLFTSYHHIISSHILCILEHQLLICPSFHVSFPLPLPTLLFSWVFFSSDSHSFHHFNVQLCHPPPLRFNTTFLYFIYCYYFLLLCIFQIISDFFPLFFSTLISSLLPFTYLAPHTFGPFL